MKNVMTMQCRFRFQCSRCGICCKTIKQVYLTPFDLYNLSKAKGVGTGKFIEKYCYFENLEQAYVPSLLLKAEDGICVFYGEQRCKAYEARPAICRLYPLGYIFSSEGDKPLYVPKEDALDRCLATGKPYKLKQWLRMHEPGISYTWDWFRVQCRINDMIENRTNECDVHAIAYQLIILLEKAYFEYDISQSFQSQYEAHKEELFDFLEQNLG